MKTKTVQPTKTYHYDCLCTSPEHSIRFVLDEWEEYQDIDLYLDVQLVQWRNIFKRIWVAIEYVFGKNKSAHWDGWILNPDDAVGLRNLLDKYISKHKEFHEIKEKQIKNKSKVKIKQLIKN